MPHFRTLRDIQFANREDDIRGATLYGVDNEKLGKIDDVIFEHASGVIRYAVVDTGGWLSHRKFLVPAARIHNYEPDPSAFQVDMVKKHVERLPAFDRALLRSEDDWRDYERNYHEWVSTGDVIHRRENPNIITPPSEEVPAEPSIAQGGGPSGQGRRLDLTPRRFATGEVSAPTSMPVPEESTNTSHAVLPTSSRAHRALGSLPDTQEKPETREPERWSRFQQRLSDECRGASATCPECERERRVA